MWNIEEWLLGGYVKVPDCGLAVWIVSALVGVASLIVTIVKFVSLKIKPWSFYMVFVWLVGAIVLVCMDIDHLIIIIGCGLPLFLLTDIALILETALRRLGRDAVWVAVGLTLFTIALFFVMAPFGKSIYHMTLPYGGPVTHATEETSRPFASGDQGTNGVVN